MMRRFTKIIAQNQDWLILVGLALIVFLLRIPSLEHPFGNDEGANAYHARLIARGEPLYGTHHSAHQLPGVYYSYALAFVLFGDSLWAVKFMVIIFTIGTAYLLYRTGKLLDSTVLGLLAAIFFVMLSAHNQLAGTSAQNEMFANLPRTAAIFSLLYLHTRQVSPWKFTVVGVLAALSFLYRANYLTPVAVTGFVLLAELWQYRRQSGTWKQTVGRGVWFSAGFAGTLLLVTAYFWAVGLLPRMLLVYPLGVKYVQFRNSVGSNLPPVYQAYWPYYPLYGLYRTNVVALVFGAIGLLTILIFRRYRSIPAIAIIVWFLLAYAQTTVARVLFYHYYLLLLPPLAVLASYPIPALYRLVSRRVPKAGTAAAWVIVLAMLAAPIWISVEAEDNYYRQFVRYKTGQQGYDEFLKKGVPVDAEKFLRVQKLADYIQERTSPDDLIYYWSGNVQVYYLADRRTPVDVVWPINVDATGPPDRVFNPKTKYIILGRSNAVSEQPEWLLSGIEQQFTREEKIENEIIYRRKD
jgi:hypothetical protein